MRIEKQTFEDVSSIVMLVFGGVYNPCDKRFV